MLHLTGGCAYKENCVGQYIALLVPKKDMARFELLISLRKQAKVTDVNEYLFVNYDKYIEGTAVMKELAQTIRKRLDTFTSSK